MRITSTLKSWRVLCQDTQLPAMDQCTSSIVNRAMQPERLKWREDGAETEGVQKATEGKLAAEHKGSVVRR